jgi:hypothetical protein
MTILVDHTAKTSLIRYVSDRIGHLHVALERQNEVSEAQVIRGQIKELRILKSELEGPKLDQTTGQTVTY